MAVWKVSAHYFYTSPKQEEAVSKAANAAAQKLGYAALKLQQQEAVVNFLSGRDVIWEKFMLCIASFSIRPFRR